MMWWDSPSPWFHPRWPQRLPVGLANHQIPCTEALTSRSFNSMLLSIHMWMHIIDQCINFPKGVRPPLLLHLSSKVSTSSRISALWNGDLERPVSNTRTCLTNLLWNFYVYILGPKKLGEYETLKAKLKKGACPKLWFQFDYRDMWTLGTPNACFDQRRGK